MLLDGSTRAAQPSIPTLALAASALPKIQTHFANNWRTGWRVRPRLVVFGNRFFIRRLRYSRYNHKDAYARGRVAVAFGVPLANGTA